jgi:hypothetical protein
MSKAKIVIAAFAAVLMLSAMVANLALAAGNWYVAGGKLPAGSKVSLASTAAVDAAMTLNDPAETIRITCTGGTGKALDLGSAFIEGPESSDLGSLAFLGCSESSPAACSVEATIQTEELMTRITFADGSVFEEFLPRQRSWFDLLIEGVVCAVAGEKPVTGSALLKLPTGATESTLQAIEGMGSVENNSLLVAGHHLFIEGGKALRKLASSLRWSFHA